MARSFYMKQIPPEERLQLDILRFKMLSRVLLGSFRKYLGDGMYGVVAFPALSPPYEAEWHRRTACL
jgi:hypothetical protein